MLASLLLALFVHPALAGGSLSVEGSSTVPKNEIPNMVLDLSLSGTIESVVPIANRYQHGFGWQVVLHATNPDGSSASTSFFPGNNEGPVISKAKIELARTRMEAGGAATFYKTLQAGAKVKVDVAYTETDILNNWKVVGPDSLASTTFVVGPSNLQVDTAKVGETMKRALEGSSGGLLVSALAATAPPAKADIGHTKVVSRELSAIQPTVDIDGCLPGAHRASCDVTGTYAASATMSVPQAPVFVGVAYVNKPDKQVQKTLACTFTGHIDMPDQGNWTASVKATECKEAGAGTEAAN